MAFREIPGYSRTAVNNGDFFKNHGRQQMRDEVTGELRFERTWQVERIIEQEDVNHTIEFGEKSVIQLAKSIGYVAKGWHELNKEKLADARAELAEAQLEVARLQEANRVLVQQMADQLADAAAEAAVEDMPTEDEL